MLPTRTTPAEQEPDGNQQRQSQSDVKSQNPRAGPGEKPVGKEYRTLPLAFSLLSLLRCHAYILTMVRLLARLEN
jgi:hypothetical protein